MIVDTHTISGHVMNFAIWAGAISLILVFVIAGLRYINRPVTWAPSPRLQEDPDRAARLERLLDERRDSLSDTNNRDHLPLPRAAGASLADALQIHASIKLHYGQYATSYSSVLARPALSNINDPITADFIEKFTTANALAPEHPDQAPADHRDKYIHAVVAAETAWEKADANARDLALSTMTESERNRIRLARAALDLALDPQALASVRETALAKAFALLKGLITLPPQLERTLRKAITTTTRQELTR